MCARSYRTRIRSMHITYGEQGVVDTTDIKHYIHSRGYAPIVISYLYLNKEKKKSKKKRKWGDCSCVKKACQVH